MHSDEIKMDVIKEEIIALLFQERVVTPGIPESCLAEIDRARFADWLVKKNIDYLNEEPKVRVELRNLYDRTEKPILIRDDIDNLDNCKETGQENDNMIDRVIEYLKGRAEKL